MFLPAYELAMFHQYFYLTEEIKKCDAYDGWSAEEQLNFYIENNGYNPFELLKDLQEQILKEYEYYQYNDSFIWEVIHCKEETTLQEIKLAFEKLKEEWIDKDIENKEVIRRALMHITFKKLIYEKI